MILKKILVPVDLSAGSKEVVDYAVLLARALGVSVTLFHVYDAPRLMSQIVPGADNDADTIAIRADALLQLGKLREVVGHEFSALEIAIECGEPTSAILSQADSGKFDLIVIGTHGRSGVDRMLMGSVAEGVVRRASIPVVTIHLPRHPLRQ